MKIDIKIEYHVKESTFIKKGEIRDIKAVNIEYCCDKMKAAFSDNFVGFGEYPPDNILNYNKEVNIYDCSPYPEGACWNEMPISYCPFCAEKIQIGQSQ
jgi:hypothetical protein